jgi:hypothetical protein
MFNTYLRKLIKWNLTVPDITRLKLLKGGNMKKLLSFNVRGVELEVSFEINHLGDLDHITGVRQMNDADLWDVLHGEVQETLREKVIEGLDTVEVPDEDR